MSTAPPHRVLLEKLIDKVEAFALVHYLDAHGLPVSLTEPHLRGAMGEIPFLETASELFLHDPLRWDEAQALIRQFRDRPAGIRGSIWVCAGCGETHEPEFGDCWNCGATRT